MTLQRVYLAFTPYHLLLALALQDRDGCPDSAVLFADEARLLSNAPAIAASVEEVVELVAAPTIELHSEWQHPARCRMAARFTDRFVQRTEPREVFITNGLRPEAQRLFRKFAGSTSFKFVEDGFDSYVGVNRADIAPWHKIAHRVLCGSPHPLSADMIDAFPYDSFHVIAPEICRAPQALVEAIPEASLRRATARMEGCLALPSPERAITDLYLLGNSERMVDPSAYLGTMREQVVRCTAEDASTYVAVKAHPREKNLQFLANVDALGDYLIPHWVPSELLAEFVSARVRVHSGLTTFIVSSRKLLPERRLLLDPTVKPEPAGMLMQWDPTMTLDDPPVAGRAEPAVGGVP